MNLVIGVYYWLRLKPNKNLSGEHQNTNLQPARWFGHYFSIIGTARMVGLEEVEEVRGRVINDSWRSVD